MVRRSPSERYIRFLLVCSNQYTNEQIKELMTQLDLLFVSLEYISRLREECQAGFPLQLRDVERHRPTREFLLKLEILDMFILDERSKKTLDYTHQILAHPRQKELVEAMLNNNASPEHIALYIRMSKGIFRDLPKESVERYESLFWDKSLVDSREMVELCEMRHLQLPSGLTAAEREQFIKIGNRNKYRDPRYISSTLPQNRITALVSQIQMGFPAEMEDMKEVYAGLHQGALAAAYVTLGKGMPMMGAEVHSLIGAAKMAKEMSETMQEEATSLSKKLQAIQIKHSTEPIRTLKLVTGGNHSTDLAAPQEEPPGSIGRREEEDG